MTNYYIEAAIKALEAAARSKSNANREHLLESARIYVIQAIQEQQRETGV